MAVQVHEEDVSAELLAAGSGFYFRKVYRALRELFQRADQESGTVLDDKGAREGGLVVAARRGVLFAEHNEACEIWAAVLDAAGENFGTEDLGCATSANGGGVIARHHLLHGGRIRKRCFDRGLWEAALNDAPALAQRLRVRKEDVHRVRFGTGLNEQVVLNRQDGFVLDGKCPGSVNENIQCFGNRALEAVFDRNDAEIGHSRIDGARYGGNAGHRYLLGTGVVLEGRFLAEGTGRAQEGQSRTCPLLRRTSLSDRAAHPSGRLRLVRRNWSTQREGHPRSRGASPRLPGPRRGSPCRCWEPAECRPSL